MTISQKGEAYTNTSLHMQHQFKLIQDVDIFTNIPAKLVEKERYTRVRRSQPAPPEFLPSIDEWTLRTAGRRPEATLGARVNISA